MSSLGEGRSQERPTLTSRGEEIAGVVAPELVEGYHVYKSVDVSLPVIVGFHVLRSSFKFL